MGSCPKGQELFIYENWGNKMKNRFDWKAYANIARRAAAESCVLLRNENETLPLKQEEKIAVFGRSQFNYYKSGTGSGGMVNTAYVTDILSALKNEESLTLDEEVLEAYESWLKDHPSTPERAGHRSPGIRRRWSCRRVLQWRRQKGMMLH